MSPPTTTQSVKTSERQAGRWPPFAASPIPPRRALLLAFGLALLTVAMFGRTVGGAWIRLFWPALQVVSLDGRVVHGTAIRPLYGTPVPPPRPGGAWTRRAPQAGDPVPVRVDPLLPWRMAPEAALNFHWLPVIEGLALAWLAHVLFLLFRGRLFRDKYGDLPPRSGKPAQWRDSQPGL